MNQYTPTFMDIETVSEYRQFSDMHVKMQELYKKKFQREIGDDNIPDPETHYANKAALYAEFGKVVCVCIGKLQKSESGDVFYIKKIASRDEKSLLIKLSDALEKSSFLVGHNGKGFDFPFLFRRYIINRLQIPAILNVTGLKPWETKLDDTMEMWSATQFKYSVGLELLCEILGIPNPKEGEITGSDVGSLYHSMFDGYDPADLPFDVEERILNKIADYCAGDTVAAANVWMTIKGYGLIDKSQIKFV